jgi:hypothetical protein
VQQAAGAHESGCADLYVGDESGNATRFSLGLLFHCKEYPAFDEAEFPWNLGWCQVSVPALL